jgi:hypothetical protein
MVVMEPSEKLIQMFIDESFSSQDERARKVGSVIGRDRFGLKRLDEQIQEQLESGNYSSFARERWISFKAKNKRCISICE